MEGDPPVSGATMLAEAVAKCPAVLPALGSLASELHAALADEGSVLITSEAGWWRRLELEMVLTVLHRRVQTDLAEAVVTAHAGDRREAEQLPFAQITAHELAARAELLGNLKEKVSAATSAQEAHAKQSGGWRPLISRVAETYQLSLQDRRILELIVVINVAHTNMQSLFPVGMTATPCEGGLLRWVFELSETEVAKVMDSNDVHPLIEDRVLQTDEDPYDESKKMLKLSSEVSRAFLGQELSAGDKLKLSGSRFLALIDGATDEEAKGADSTMEAGEHTQLCRSSSAGQLVSNAAVTHLLGELGLDDFNTLNLGNEDDENLGLDNDDDGDGGIDEPDDSPVLPQGAEISDVTGEPRAFTCELDYLNDQFQTILTQVKVAKLRVENELKEADVNSSRMPWERQGKKGPGMGELEAKLNLGERKLEASLELTRASGSFCEWLAILLLAAIDCHIQISHMWCLPVPWEMITVSALRYVVSRSQARRLGRTAAALQI